MKRNLLFVFGIALVAFLASGCYANAQIGEPLDATAVATAEFPTGDPLNGCTIVVDQFGEREVCSYFYSTAGGVIWWDDYFHVWVGTSGYWAGGVYRRGYWPGYVDRYRHTYQAHGWHAQHFGWWSNGVPHTGKVETGFRNSHPGHFNGGPMNMHAAPRGHVGGHR